MDLIKFWKPMQENLEALEISQVGLKSPNRKILAEDDLQTKIQLIANGNLKSPAFHPNGSSIFKLYNFNYWQYIDQYIHWDSLIPPSDLIEAAHTNGVLIYGTLFFNWSNSFRDQLRLLEWLTEDSEDSGTFFYARQLVDIAIHYGFDGYFINQETTGPLLEGKAEKMRHFMLYAKEYASQQDKDFYLAWYDAMANDGLRHHYDEVNPHNDLFIKPTPQINIPADDFFINFNWNHDKNSQTVAHMKKINRNPYDAYAGFELQQNSYNTVINYDALFAKDESQPMLSLGLFAADSILGLAADGEDYHQQEERFWSDFSLLDKESGPKNWQAISRFASLKSNITGSNFHTNFNTGHGKDWFINGLAQDLGEWNQRGMQAQLPSWRWRVEGDDLENLNAGFHFDDAYNGGSSVQISGGASQVDDLQWYLFGGSLKVLDGSKIKIVLKASANLDLALVLEVGKEEVVYPLDVVASTSEWQVVEVALGELAGATVDTISLRIHPLTDDAIMLRLGEFSFVTDDSTPEAVADIKWLQQFFFDGKQAVGVIQVTHPNPEQVAYYEIYQETDHGWQIVNASRNQTIRLPRLSRMHAQKGLEQKLSVIAVGENGQRSLASDTSLKWPIAVDEMTDPVASSNNLMLEAKVIDFSHEEQAERARNALNGTLAGVSDKWVSLKPDPNHLSIAFEKAELVQYMVFDHAGVGGESVDDGLMNTKDFDVHYRNSEQEEWNLALSVRDNRQHQSHHILAQPITAKYWRLTIHTSHNGSPWGGVRLYNWAMYPSSQQSLANLALSNMKLLKNSKDEHTLLCLNVKVGMEIQLFDRLTAIEPIVSQSVADDFCMIPIEAGKTFYYQLKDAQGVTSNRVKVADEILVIDDLEIEIQNSINPVAFKDGYLSVRFNDQSLNQINIPLNHPSIEIIANNTLSASVDWLGERMTDDYPIYLVEDEAAVLKSIRISAPPRQYYYIWEAFDPMDGMVELNYADESVRSQLPVAQLNIQEFDTSELGTFEGQMAYLGHTVKFNYQVYPYQLTVNKEKLEQKITEIDAFVNALDDSIRQKQEIKKLINLTQKTHTQISNADFSQAEIDQFWKALNEAMKEIQESI
ncbi:endo-beta-N-acetylglucosaminidase [Fundicoccus sp. Sow4_H7]|uniref:endo-beta-N-acetylglucosaminidase n=1 Tax=Fundicoccus sp. Sow4_H7 TaxID=3438784 RepID=UPI003F908285